MLDRSYWRKRKVFLTGHTGFKGGWLCLWLDALGAEVTGYALDPPTDPNLFTQAKVSSRVRSIHGDVRDYGHLSAALNACDPDVVIHMAAQSVVRRGYDDPIETYSSNVMGTVHILEALRQRGRPSVVVNVTSDKCYENREWVWGYREDERIGGRDPYSNSKGCAELVNSAFRESYFPPAAIKQHGIALASARAGNAIGGGDWTRDQLVPDLMRAFLAGRACQIRSPGAIRPWQFLLEPLHGYLLLCERLSEDPSAFASGWNFGPADGDAKPVAWIANEMARVWGDGASWSRDGASHPHEALHLKLDTSKARNCLEWEPVLPLQQSLGWIVEWYRAFRDGKDLEEATRNQIEHYEALTRPSGGATTTPARPTGLVVEPIES